MALGRIRPRFKAVIDGAVDEQIQRLRAEMDRRTGFVARVLDRHIDITVTRDRRHRWSPCLQLQLEQNDDTTVVHGLVGPHPNVWTLFAFVNITAATIVAFGSIIAASQLKIGSSPWGFWPVAGGALILIVAYGLSQIGQRYAAEQTAELIELVNSALETHIG